MIRTPSTLHFALGMALGMLIVLRPIYRAWIQAKPLSTLIARGMLLSYGLGIYSTIPAITRRLTGNTQTGSATGWNLFLFYPLFDRLPIPSIFVGEMAMALLFMLQYAIILLALRRARTGLIAG